MHRDQHITDLARRAREALAELEKAVSTAAPDSQKEIIADRFNAISDEIAKIGAWDFK